MSAFVTGHWCCLSLVPLVTGTVCHWYCLSLVLFVTGTVCHWYCLSLLLLVIGAVCHWDCLSLVLLVTGTACYWYCLSLVLLVTGTACHWCCLSLVLFVTGTACHWFCLSLVLFATGTVSLVLFVTGTVCHRSLVLKAISEAEKSVVSKRRVAVTYVRPFMRSDYQNRDRDSDEYRRLKSSSIGSLENVGGVRLAQAGLQGVIEQARCHFCFDRFPECFVNFIMDLLPSL